MSEFKVNDRCEVFGTGTHGDGMTLTILGKAPNKAFKLPNGQKHEKSKTDNDYVVKLDKKTHAPIEIAGGLVTHQFMVEYGVVSGDKLRLITNP